jgi:hypothetical protein
MHHFPVQLRSLDGRFLLHKVYKSTAFESLGGFVVEPSDFFDFTAFAENVVDGVVVDGVGEIANEDGPGEE